MKFFARFSFEPRKQLCKAMRLISATPETTIFEQGDTGHHFFILFTGSVNVIIESRSPTHADLDSHHRYIDAVAYNSSQVASHTHTHTCMGYDRRKSSSACHGKKQSTPTRTTVSTLDEGQSFGELALSEENGIRRATVISIETTELLVLDRFEYIPLIQQYQKESHAEYVSMLKTIPCFTGDEWDDLTLEAMCSVMVEKNIQCHATVCTQVWIYLSI